MFNPHSPQTANKANQPQLPTMPPDFSQPITVRGSELAQAIAEAQSQGFHCHRMKVLPEVIYELQFFRLAGTAQGRPETIKESPKRIFYSRAIVRS